MKCFAGISGKRTVNLISEPVLIDIADNMLSLPVEPDSFVFISLKDRK
jgi:hypothetical protein